MPSRIIGVIHIGRTIARVALVDLDEDAELEARKARLPTITDGPYPHYDAGGIWAFVTDSIADLNRIRPFEALSITAHGATAALLDEAGELALPVLETDYAGPDVLSAEYGRLRPDFLETFSPRLSAGHNLGAQLFWQSRTFAREFGRTRSILPYAQYWGYRLTGVTAAEITSLGCHTDLWNLETDLYSSLVVGQGWLDKMPEVRPASDVIGIVTPELCLRLGLRPRVPVHVGIEETNAALLPHLLEHKPPFAIVSTGPEVRVHAPGGNLATLDPGRGCLALLDAFGHPLPSARFPGGLEFVRLVGEELPTHVGEAAVARVLDEAIMLLPSVTEGAGPFPRSRAHWTHPEHTLDREARFVAVSFYLALMTAECLELTGAEGNTVVEGPFATNRLFLEMLIAATGRPVEPASGAHSGATLGAAMLARMQPRPASNAVRAPIQGSPIMSSYAGRWRAAARG